MARAALWLVVLLAACTANPSEPPRMIAAKSVPAYEEPDSPEPAAEKPAADKPAATPEPVLPIWWCTCYARTGAEPMTACRQSREECDVLADKARQAGGDGIAPVSLTHSCRDVSGEHPGDVLDGRDKWQPSKKPGSWVSPGACRLPGPGDAVPTIDDLEVFGGLRRGMAARDIVARIGESGPKTDGFDRIDTTSTQTWPYPEHDLELILKYPRKRNAWILDEIVAGPGCGLRTSRDIGIGSTRAEVVAAYAKDFRDEAEDTEADPATLARTAAEADAGTDIFIGLWESGGIHFKLDPETDRVIHIRIRGPVC